MRGILENLYVFPLVNMVFYPTTTLPLNIFEPRYVQMVNDSLEHGHPIALSSRDPTLPREPDSPVRSIIAGFGTPVVLHRREDGSMVILLHGKGKARLGTVVSVSPYITCHAELVDDETQVDDENGATLDRLHRTLLKWIKQNINEPEQRKALLASLTTPQRILETLAMVRLRDAEIQQTILEISDINQRLRLMKYII